MVASQCVLLLVVTSLGFLCKYVCTYLGVIVSLSLLVLLNGAQGGLSLTVSSMVRIVNASGLSLELQCRRPNQEGEGAVVLLEDGDIIDDSMGSFDALHLQGELRKALTSFNVGRQQF